MLRPGAHHGGGGAKYRSVADRRGSVGHRRAVADGLRAPAGSRPEGRRDPGDERHRHRAMGHEGQAFWRARAQLLGGAARKEVAAYATGLYRRKSGDPLTYLPEEAAGYAAEGFRAVKLKVGFGIAEDAAVTRAVREAIGPDVALMVDANHAYDAIAAIRLGRLIERHDIGWFEEPVPPEDVAGYRAVKSALTIPVAGGECEFTRFGFRELFVSHALDIAQPDTCAAGGLSECKKIADMSEAFGIRYNPHVWGTGIAIAASL